MLIHSQINFLSPQKCFEFQRKTLKDTKAEREINLLTTCLYNQSLQNSSNFKLILKDIIHFFKEKLTSDTVCATPFNL